MFRVIRCRDDRHIRQSPVQTVDDIVRASIPQIEFDLRKFLHETADPSRSEERCHPVDRGQAQPAGQIILESRHFRLDFIRQFQHLAGALQQEPAGFRQGDLPFPSDEQRNAELSFQFPDRHGKRRLAHHQSFCRTGKVSFHGNTRKISERLQIHPIISFYDSADSCLYFRIYYIGFI